MIQSVLYGEKNCEIALALMDFFYELSLSEAFLNFNEMTIVW